MPTTFAVPDGRVAMAATTYTGNGSTQSISNAVNAVSFQPDLVWMKARVAGSNNLVDSVRGVNKILFSDGTTAETTYTDNLTSFNAGGFSVGASASSNVNINTNTYVGWQWKAGGTAVSNTAGTITSSVSANTTAGFSVVTFTGNGVDTLSGVATVGHGLGVTPSFIITKKRSSGTDYQWSTYHISNGNANVWLNSTSAKNPGNWNTAPAANVFTPPVSLYGNESGVNYVAYCWAPVAGYSAFGSYTGNGSADGPFIYTGFRPRYFLTKRTDATNSRWIVMDTSRDQTNVASLSLWPNASNVEYNGGGYWLLDFLSNGFKIRGYQSGDSEWNVPGANFIYAAFAENPLKYANAR